jgi:hypothetical protein
MLATHYTFHTQMLKSVKVVVKKIKFGCSLALQ